MKYARALVALMLGGCGPFGPPAPLARGRIAPALLPVLAPESETDDDPGVLTDGTLSGLGWFCSGSRGPQRYEVMFRDGAPRALRAVGFVLGNVGPGAPGPLSVRVQRGHGVVAPGVAFRVRGVPEEEPALRPAVPGAGPSGARRYVIELPEEARGDHVLVRFEARARRATARCVGELELYLAGDPLPGPEEARRLTAELDVPALLAPDRSAAPAAPSSAGPDARGNAGADAGTDAAADAGGDPAR